MLGIPTPPELGAGNATSPLVVGGPLAIGPSVPRAILDMPLAGDLSLRRGTGVATFTRSTIKTFLDRIDGLTKTAAIDVAAFEQNGILIEGASTNLLLRSEEFDNAIWTAATPAGTTANFAVAPDGTTTAEKIVSDQGNVPGARKNQTATVTASTAKTFSIWFKLSGGQTGGKTRVNVSGSATYENDNITLTNDWQRFTIAIPASDTATSLICRVYPTNSTGSENDECLIWGAQLEELPFASSYIKTVASTVTRTADNLSIDAANIPAPTLAYSVSALIDILGSNSATQDWFDVAGESFRVGRADTGGVSQAFHGGNAGVDFVSGSNINGQQNLVTTFNGTTFEYFQNKVSEGSFSSFTAITGTKTSITIGNRVSATHLFGHIKDFRIYDVALTAAQVRTL